MAFKTKSIDLLFDSENNFFKMSFPSYFSEILDGKEITETSRQFLRKWHANKETVKKKRDDMYHSAQHGDGNK